ncbi:MAG: hypothetical protein LRY51_12880 [Geovibrio sp.]|nr:hypothetical protein [Geovibrio sp.]
MTKEIVKAKTVINETLSKSVDVVTFKGAVWFYGRGVAKALGYRGSRLDSCIRKYCKESVMVRSGRDFAIEPIELQNRWFIHLKGVLELAKHSPEDSTPVLDWINSLALTESNEEKALSTGNSDTEDAQDGASVVSAPAEKALHVFSHPDFGITRVVIDSGTLLFVARDVAAAIGFSGKSSSNETSYIRKYCRNIVKIDASHILNMGGGGLLLIPLSDVSLLVHHPLADTLKARIYLEWLEITIIPLMRQFDIVVEPTSACIEQVQQNANDCLVYESLILLKYQGKDCHIMVDASGDKWLIMNELARILGFIGDGKQTLRRYLLGSGQKYAIVKSYQHKVAVLHESVLRGRLSSASHRRTEVKHFLQWLNGDVLPKEEPSAVESVKPAVPSETDLIESDSPVKGNTPEHPVGNSTESSETQVLQAFQHTQFGQIRIIDKDGARGLWQKISLTYSVIRKQPV